MADNFEISKKGIVIMYDNKPPDISININNGQFYTKSSTLILSLSYSDSGSGVFKMAFRTRGTNWSDWERNLPSRLFDVTKVNGEKVVYFRVKDKANNIAETYDKIILDTKPPYALNITINNGAHVTNSTLLSLTFFALDNLSGVDKILLSVNSINWGEWENYEIKRKFNISSDNGIHTIWFKVKDRIGNVAEPVSATILLNTTEPFTNNNQDKINPRIDETSNNLIIWIILIVTIFIVIISFVFIFIFRKRKINKNGIKRAIGEPLEIKTEKLDQQKFDIQPSEQQSLQIQQISELTDITKQASDSKQGSKNQLLAQNEQIRLNICSNCGLEMANISTKNGYYCLWCQK
jgi:hypothetical protein